MPFSKQLLKIEDCDFWTQVWFYRRRLMEEAQDNGFGGGSSEDHDPLEWYVISALSLNVREVIYKQTILVLDQVLACFYGETEAQTQVACKQTLAYIKNTLLPLWDRYHHQFNQKNTAAGRIFYRWLKNIVAAELESLLEKNNASQTSRLTKNYWQAGLEDYEGQIRKMLIPYTPKTYRQHPDRYFALCAKEIATHEAKQNTRFAFWHQFCAWFYDIEKKRTFVGLQTALISIKKATEANHKETEATLQNFLHPQFEEKTRLTDAFKLLSHNKNQSVLNLTKTIHTFLNRLSLGFKKRLYQMKEDVHSNESQPTVTPKKSAIMLQEKMQQAREILVQGIGAEITTAKLTKKLQRMVQPKKALFKKLSGMLIEWPQGTVQGLLALQATVNTFQEKLQSILVTREAYAQSFREQESQEQDLEIAQYLKRYRNIAANKDIAQSSLEGFLTLEPHDMPEIDKELWRSLQDIAHNAYDQEKAYLNKEMQQVEKDMTDYWLKKAKEMQLSCIAFQDRIKKSAKKSKQKLQGKLAKIEEERLREVAYLSLLETWQKQIEAVQAIATTETQAALNEILTAFEEVRAQCVFIAFPQLTTINQRLLMVLLRGQDEEPLPLLEDAAEYGKLQEVLHAYDAACVKLENQSAACFSDIATLLKEVYEEYKKESCIYYSQYGLFSKENLFMGYESRLEEKIMLLLPKCKEAQEAVWEHFKLILAIIAQNGTENSNEQKEILKTLQEKHLNVLGTLENALVFVNMSEVKQSIAEEKTWWLQSKFLIEKAQDWYQNYQEQLLALKERSIHRLTKEKESSDIFEAYEAWCAFAKKQYESLESMLYEIEEIPANMRSAVSFMVHNQAIESYQEGMQAVFNQALASKAQEVKLYAVLEKEREKAEEAQDTAASKATESLKGENKNIVLLKYLECMRSWQIIVNSDSTKKLSVVADLQVQFETKCRLWQNNVDALAPFVEDLKSQRKEMLSWQKGSYGRELASCAPVNFDELSLAELHEVWQRYQAAISKLEKAQTITKKVSAESASSYYDWEKEDACLSEPLKESVQGILASTMRFRNKLATPWQVVYEKIKARRDTLWKELFPKDHPFVEYFSPPSSKSVEQELEEAYAARNFSEETAYEMVLFEKHKEEIRKYYEAKIRKWADIDASGIQDVNHAHVNLIIEFEEKYKKQFQLPEIIFGREFRKLVQMSETQFKARQAWVYNYLQERARIKTLESWFQVPNLEVMMLAAQLGVDPIQVERQMLQNKISELLARVEKKYYTIYTRSDEKLDPADSDKRIERLKTFMLLRDLPEYSQFYALTAKLAFCTGERKGYSSEAIKTEKQEIKTKILALLQAVEVKYQADEALQADLAELDPADQNSRIKCLISFMQQKNWPEYQEFLALDFAFNKRNRQLEIYRQEQKIFQSDDDLDIFSSFSDICIYDSHSWLSSLERMFSARDYILRLLKEAEEKYSATDETLKANLAMLDPSDFSTRMQCLLRFMRQKESEYEEILQTDDPLSQYKGGDDREFLKIWFRRQKKLSGCQEADKIRCKNREELSKYQKFFQIEDSADFTKMYSRCSSELSNYQIILESIEYFYEKKGMIEKFLRKYPEVRTCQAFGLSSENKEISADLGKGILINGVWLQKYPQEEQRAWLQKVYEDRLVLKMPAYFTQFNEEAVSELVTPQKQEQFALFFDMQKQTATLKRQTECTTLSAETLVNWEEVFFEEINFPKIYQYRHDEFDSRFSRWEIKDVRSEENEYNWNRRICFIMLRVVAYLQALLECIKQNQGGDLKAMLQKIGADLGLDKKRKILTQHIRKYLRYYRKYDSDYKQASHDEGLRDALTRHCVRMLKQVAKNLEGPHFVTYLTLQSLSTLEGFEERAKAYQEMINYCLVKQKENELEKEAFLSRFPIPPEAAQREAEGPVATAYKILEVDPEDKDRQDKAKKAYKALALKWHPDKNKEPKAQERFQEIQQAYDRLFPS